MAVYVTLGRFTQHGRSMLPAGQFSWQKSIEHMEALGGRVIAGYALVGEYDALVISEWDDERAFLRGTAGLITHDVVTTNSSIAIPLDEFGDLMQYKPQ